MFQCQVLSARSLWLSPVTAGNQLTAPVCQTCHSAKIKTAEKALASGKPEIPSPCVRAVTVSGSNIIVSPWHDAQGSYLAKGRAVQCPWCVAAVPGLSGAAAAAASPTAKTSDWAQEMDGARSCCKGARCHIQAEEKGH